MSHVLNYHTKMRILGRIAEQLKEVIRTAIAKGYTGIELHDLEVMTFEHLSLEAEDCAEYMAPFVLAAEEAPDLKEQRKAVLDGYSSSSGADLLFGSGFVMSSSTGWTEEVGEWVCNVTAESGTEQRSAKLNIVFDAGLATVQKVFMNDEQLALA